MARTKLADRVIPTYSKGEEIMNMVSHILGGTLGIVATVLCVIFAAINKNVYGVVSGSIFGFSLIMLYTMSSIYHGLKEGKAKKVFQVLDHCSIFLLIAGTYTPITLVPLREHGALGWVLFGLIWGAAVLGIVFNSIDLERFRKVSVVCYVVMGWAIIFAIKPLINSMPKLSLVFLLIGGALYSLGVIFYAIKKIKYFHSVWHLFTIGGSVFHYFAILVSFLAH